MKYLIALCILILPVQAFAFTEAEAKKQLSLEAENISLYGNPFGPKGKFEELYDPITLKPWWQIQLEFEAWSLETYGNPFGYPIVQKVLPDAPDIFQPKVQNSPVEPSEPVVGVSEPAVVKEPVQTNIESIKAEVWIERRGYDQPSGLQPYIHYKGTWDTGTGNLFCKNPNFPNGAYLFKDKPSGFVQYELVKDWKLGDAYECTWTVGGKKLTVSGTYTKQ